MLPSQKRIIKRTVLGALLGLALGIGIASIWKYWNKEEATPMEMKTEKAAAAGPSLLPKVEGKNVYGDLEEAFSEKYIKYARDSMTYTIVGFGLGSVLQRKPLLALSQEEIEQLKEFEELVGYFTRIAEMFERIGKPKLVDADPELADKSDVIQIDRDEGRAIKTHLPVTEAIKNDLAAARRLKAALKTLGEKNNRKHLGYEPGTFEFFMYRNTSPAYMVGMDRDYIYETVKKIEQMADGKQDEDLALIRTLFNKIADNANLDGKAISAVRQILDDLTDAQKKFLGTFSMEFFYYLRTIQNLLLFAPVPKHVDDCVVDASKKMAAFLAENAKGSAVCDAKLFGKFLPIVEAPINAIVRHLVNMIKYTNYVCDLSPKLHGKFTPVETIKPIVFKKAGQWSHVRDAIWDLTKRYSEALDAITTA